MTPGIELILCVAEFVLVEELYVNFVSTCRERAQNTTQLEANIQHLKPGATYTFRVVAYNKAGPSPEAAEIQVDTEAECK